MAYSPETVLVEPATRQISAKPPVYLSATELNIAGESYKLASIRGSYVEEVQPPEAKPLNGRDKPLYVIYKIFAWIGLISILAFVLVMSFLIGGNGDIPGTASSSKSPQGRYCLALLTYNGIVMALPSDDQSLLKTISDKINKEVGYKPV
jgi:hypothetical protein